MVVSPGRFLVAARKEDIHPPKVLRAHRPRHADTQQPLPADVQEHYVDTENLPRQQTWLQRHLFEIGIGMLLMLLLWYAGATCVLPFIQNTLNRWDCGANLICQYDLNVGHGGTSHFITEYWHGQVIVIELQNGDPSKAKICSQTIINTAETNGKHLVSLQTAYVSQHPIKGKPDLVATISGFALPVIFYNTGDSFSREDKK
jgi:hypothetical protein